MRIGVDATALYGRYGGVEYSLWNLLGALRVENSSHEFRVFIPNDGPPPAQLRAFDENWKFIRLPFRGEEKLRRIFWQQAVLPGQLTREKCDLLHSPTYVAPLRTSVPVALTVYDLIALSQPQFATPLNRRHYGLMLPPSIQGARRIIAPSENVKWEISLRFPEAAQRTRVVPLGVEPIFFQAPSAPALDEVRNRYDLPEKYLLFVGNFEPKKNLVNLLRALKTLPDAPTLIVAGGMRAWPNSEIESSHDKSLHDESSHDEILHNEPCENENPIARKIGAGSTPRVRGIGYVARRDLPALYAQCEAFVFPSLAEGFGLPVLEALACGAPVVTSAAVPLPDLSAAAIICDPHSPASIASAIAGVLGSASERARLKAAGREHARPFTWRRAAHQTEEIYEETVAAK